MLKSPQQFTANKQVVRDLQCEAIRQHLAAKLGKLSYIGLPSSSLEDVQQWFPLFERITAVERGEAGKEWVLQHELQLNAFKLDLSQKLSLLRGDIDAVLIKGADDFGNKPVWPYDVVSLDYSGGLFYQDQNSQPTRLEAIRCLFQHQQTARASEFVLLLSFRLDRIDQREVRESLNGIRRDLKRYGFQGDQVVDAYLDHPKEQARLKLYVMHMINYIAVQAHFDTTSESPAFYFGNRDAEMMAFRFHHKAARKTFAPRSPKERLNQMINRRMIEIVRGKQTFTNLGLPLIKAESDA